MANKSKILVIFILLGFILSVPAIAANGNVSNQITTYDGEIDNDAYLPIGSHTTTAQVPQSSDDMSYTNDDHNDNSSQSEDNVLTSTSSSTTQNGDTSVLTSNSNNNITGNNDDETVIISNSNDHITGNNGDGDNTLSLDTSSNNADGSCVLATEISISTGDINVGDDAVIDLSIMPSDVRGNVTVTIDGRKYTLLLKNGKDKLSVPDLSYGMKDVLAIYDGNDKYQASQTSISFDVNKVNSTVGVECDDIYVGDDEVITVNVPSDATGNITILVNSESYTTSALGGVAFFTVSDLKAGTYPIQAIYLGDEKYNSAIGSNTFKVFKFRTDIETKSPDITVGSNGVIKVKLERNATGNVIIEIDHQIYNEPVENGEAIFYIPGLDVGEYIVIVRYLGDDYYYPENTICVLNVVELEIENETPSKVEVAHKAYVNDNSIKAGNPIFVLLLASVALCAYPIRRFKR